MQEYIVQNRSPADEHDEETTTVVSESETKIERYFKSARHKTAAREKTTNRDKQSGKI